MRMPSRAIESCMKRWVWIRPIQIALFHDVSNKRSMIMQALLGIDLGTTGVKAALFAAADGRVISWAFFDYPLVHPHPGWAEQDPEQWWQASVSPIRSCLSGGVQYGVAPGDVRGVGLSGQMHGVVLLDEEYKVLRPCIIWADQRSDAQCRWMTEQVGASRLIEYVSNPALPGFSAPKALWVRDNEPEIFAQTRTIILPKDYIRFRLTGVLAMEISDAAGTCLLDVKHGRWSSEVLEAIDFDPSLLPPVVAADAVCGAITGEVEQLTGLLAGTPVAGGGADNACGAVGNGVVRPGLALVSIGTSGVLLAHAATPQVDVSGTIPRVHTFNHAVPHACYLLIREAEGVWPGSDGLFSLPYLQGERTPHLDAYARGGWIGLTASHNRRHLVRSVLEGVAFSLKDCFAIIQEQGLKLEQLRATGGGAKSLLWRQILADVLGVQLVTTTAEEGPAFGAALLAGVASGVYASVQQACEITVRVVDRTEPRPELEIVYGQAYEKYRALYPALKPIFTSPL